MVNKYPQHKKCPKCGRTMTYLSRGYTCHNYDCYNIETNTNLKSVKSHKINPPKKNKK